MAGLILGDQLEIFHVLRPSVRVSGIVTRAHQLDCTAKVLDERHGKAKLNEVLNEIYQVGHNVVTCVLIQCHVVSSYNMVNYPCCILCSIAEQSGWF